VQERQRAARKARSVLGVIALAGIVLAVMVSRYVIVLSLVVGVAWMATVLPPDQVGDGHTMGRAVDLFDLPPLPVDVSP